MSEWIEIMHTNNIIENTYAKPGSTGRWFQLLGRLEQEDQQISFKASLGNLEQEQKMLPQPLSHGKLQGLYESFVRSWKQSLNTQPFSSLKKFHLMCMVVLPACMSVHCINALCPWRPEEDIGSLWTGVSDGCETLCGFWKLNQDPLQEQQILLTTEPSLQPPNM